MKIYERLLRWGGNGAQPNQYGVQDKRNDIQSNGVSPLALVGHNICVLPGSVVDDFSKIHNYAWIGRNCTVTRATIGHYAGLANNISVGPGEHDTRRIANTALFTADPYSELTKAPCHVGPDVWIGVDTVIRRGVSIGAGAVVGANSFVNKDVPPYAIVAGSPARHIRYRFTASQIDEIMKSEWWTFDLEQARKILEHLEKRLGIQPNE